MADDDRVGLCARCRHARRVPTAQTLYWMCERSLTDARFEKYPRLPIVRCAGFEAEPAEPDRSGAPDANDD